MLIHHIHRKKNENKPTNSGFTAKHRANDIAFHKLPTPRRLLARYSHSRSKLRCPGHSFCSPAGHFVVYQTNMEYGKRMKKIRKFPNNLQKLQKQKRRKTSETSKNLHSPSLCLILDPASGPPLWKPIFIRGLSDWSTGASGVKNHETPSNHSVKLFTLIWMLLIQR